ncbi:5-formyltetrahydrofolate cyclo-ligase [uncultured Corynebacterium sp.]|uniref:5-formyltetrahydrofolate cyclo-ligase n=1 Tax=uncultured Corynebacterium sp. TaxID=159447 RepID=UPI0025981D5F|nr:5-formyltetrahydrofolate cyclo-ligase [uncultured Corynebacterium sp.]
MDAKQETRQARIAYRRHLRANPDLKARLDRALTDNVLALLAELGAHGSVAAYEPLPSEPGGASLLPALGRACRTVLLPVTLPDGILAWTPTTALAQRDTSSVLGSCDVVLAPGLAVDKRGMRLGKGGGYYDRALAGLDVSVAALLYDDDLLDEVPHEPHDVPVGMVVTPSGIFRPEGNRGGAGAV